MKFFKSIIKFSLVTALSIATNAIAQPTTGSFIITNITVIDGVSGQKKSQDVWIKDNRIHQVTNTGEVSFPSSSQTISGTGKYLIPGLWDMHIHLDFEPELKSVMFPLLIANGITSVRDTGGKIEQLQQWKQLSLEQVDTPNVYFSGPLIDGEPTVYDGSGPNHPDISVTVDSVDEVNRVVDQLAGQGVSFLKAYEMLSPQAFYALLSKAKHYGLPVTGHIPLSLDVISAADAGLKSMEHLRNIELSCSSEHQQLLVQREALLTSKTDQLGSKLRAHIHSTQRAPALSTNDVNHCEKVIEAIVKNDVWQIPTLSLITAKKYPYFSEQGWQDNYQYLPEKLQQKWLKISTYYMHKINEGKKQHGEKFLANENFSLELIKKLRNKGAVILPGTDSPIGLLTPGFSLHEELKRLVLAGLTPLEVITAATLKPAQYFGIQDETGTIEAGKIADLIILDKNPLEDITHTTSINSVIKAGNVLDRKYLDGLLSKENK